MPPIPSPEWVLSSSELRNVIWAELPRPCGPLTLHQAESLTSLRLASTRIENYGGLESASNLKTLTLDGYSGSALPDLSALAGLPHLEDLTVQNYPWTDDLTAVGQLHSLKKLTLYNLGFLSDLGPLANLTSLEELSLSSFPFSDLTPLTDLRSLVRLTVSDNTFLRNISPLSGLTGLAYLDISNTYVGDLEPLRGLSNLQALIATDTPGVDDWTPVDHVPVVEGRPVP